MNGVEERVLDFWDAYDRIDPIPSPWFQTATVCQQLEFLMMATSASAGHKHTPRKFEDFLPPYFLAPKTEKKRTGAGPRAFLKRLEKKING